VASNFRVKPGSAAELSKRQTDDRAGLAGKAEGKKELTKLVDELSLLQSTGLPDRLVQGADCD
jgi:hypothetical protein